MNSWDEELIAPAMHAPKKCGLARLKRVPSLALYTYISYVCIYIYDILYLYMLNIYTLVHMLVRIYTHICFFLFFFGVCVCVCVRARAWRVQRTV